MTRFPQKLHRGGAANATDNRVADARPRGGARLLAVAALSGALALGIAACGGSDDSTAGSSGGSIDLVAYSTPEEAYTERPRARRSRRPRTATGVEFSNSFGASGDQSRAVEAGQPADVVHFALEPDMTRLVDAGLVAEDWDQNEYDGIVEDSVVVFIVRKGNPENIQTWDDLLRDDVEVITPNPFTSGGARWNIMAAYGTQVLTEGKSEEEALQFVADLLENTAGPGRERPRRAGDVHSAARATSCSPTRTRRSRAQDAGEDVDYVVPDEHDPDRDADRGRPTDADDAAQAFLDYLYSDEAQQLWADNGYRPVDESVLKAERGQVPDPAGPVHDRRPRWLGPGHHRVLRPGERFGRRDREQPGGCARSESRGRRNCQGTARGRASGSASAAPGLTRGLVIAYLSLIVLIPLAAVVSKSFEGGLAAFWDDVTGAAGARGAEADRDRVARSSSRSTRRRDDHRLGARPRRVPRQADRQLADRPAVRAADDRRRPHAAGALRRRQPARALDVAFTRVGVVHGAAVRHPAVRRPRRCSRCCSSSTATWRRRPPRSAPGR